MHKRQTVCAIFLILVVNSAATMGPGTATGQSTHVAAQIHCQSLFAPSYYWYDLEFFPQWDALIHANTRNDMMIVAGIPYHEGKAEPAFDWVIKQARRNHIRVLGYVQTYFGKWPQDEVISMIHAFQDWYQLDGIFIDEVLPSDENLDYYRALVAAVRQKPGQLVVLNPGGTASAEYVDMADMIVTFEGSYNDYLHYQVPRFMLNYPPQRFIHLVHSTPKDDFEHAVALSHQRNASWIYVTDDVPPNAYHRLPAYWQEETGVVNATC